MVLGLLISLIVLTLIDIAISVKNMLLISKKHVFTTKLMTHVSSNVSQAAHAECSKCHLTVARYTPDSVGNLVCANCKSI